MHTTIPILLLAPLLTPGPVAQQAASTRARAASRVPVDLSLQSLADPDDANTGGRGLSGPPAIDAVTRLACLPAIRDQTTGACLTASSVPMPGALYPLGPKFNIDAAGNIRIGMGSIYKATKLFIHTRGSSGNTGVGDDALGNVTTGSANTALGSEALALNTAGVGNTAVGTEALRSNTSGSRNTASGERALQSNTTGYSNTATGERALQSNTTGSYNTAIGHRTLISNTTGYRNTATGSAALYQNTTGFDNTASGHESLYYNSTGYGNTAVGTEALRSNTSGSRNTALGASTLSLNVNGMENTAVGTYALKASNTNGNTAIGHSALLSNSTGSGNVALGKGALRSNTTGYFNTGIGSNALLRCTGSRNIALGYDAGFFIGPGSDNIMIGSTSTYFDYGAIRIGTPGTHTTTFVAGIHGVTTGYANAVSVLIDSAGQLGTVSSARRFKKDIEDMGDATEPLLDLRPVVFRYKKQKKAHGDDAPLEYGLIAEEVAEIFPDLVIYDEEGRPETVKYRLLGSMLLNELKNHVCEENAAIEEARGEIEALRAANADLRDRVERLEARGRDR